MLGAVGFICLLPSGARNEAIPSLTLCKLCSRRKLVLGLLLEEY